MRTNDTNDHEGLPDLDPTGEPLDLPTGSDDLPLADDAGSFRNPFSRHSPDDTESITDPVKSTDDVIANDTDDDDFADIDLGNPTFEENGDKFTTKAFDTDGTVDSEREMFNEMSGYEDQENSDVVLQGRHDDNWDVKGITGYDEEEVIAGAPLPDLTIEENDKGITVITSDTTDDDETHEDSLSSAESEEVSSSASTDDTTVDNASSSTEDDEEEKEVIYKKERPLLRLGLIIGGSAIAVVVLLFLTGMLIALFGGRPPTLDPEVFSDQLDNIFNQINGETGEPSEPPSELTPSE